MNHETTIHNTKNNKANLWIAFSIAVLYFIFNFALISNGHFHEDAYILFIYVENFVNGNGIVFYPDGPHAEGATDFLWLMLLIFLGKLGLNVGTSVILLNSIGAFIMCHLVNVEISNSKIKNKELLYLLYPFVFLVIVQQPLYAALGGFSVFLYMALTLLAFVSVYKKKYILYTPYIGLIIALFRPDGVLIGIGFTFVGFYIAYKKHLTKQYMIGIIFGLVVGISYFVWRYNYFENLLPLPLYVKSHGTLTAGLHENFTWATRKFYIFIPILYLAIINKKFKSYLFLAAPVILLFIVLTAATQTQNIGYRFQGPILIVAYYILVLLVVEYMENHIITKRIKWLLSIFVIGLILLGLRCVWQTQGIMRFYYVNQAPIVINKHLPNGSTIALTEAGRLAYWNQQGQHKIIDLVGLNSEYSAKNTISSKFLEKISADLIMYYHPPLLINTEWLNSYNAKVVLLTDQDINFFTNREIFSDSERELISKHKNAAIISTQYLRKHFDEYDIFIVDENENMSFNHVYAFKKTLQLRDKMHTLLKDSFQRESAMSYYEMFDMLKP